MFRTPAPLKAEVALSQLAFGTFGGRGTGSQDDAARDVVVCEDDGGRRGDDEGGGGREDVE